MQVEISKTVGRELKDAILETVWIQWRSLGTFIDSDRFASSLVDPEALLLMSLTLRHHEKRLWDLMASWARNGSQLFGIQRVKNLQKNFPQLTRDRLSEFAQRAMVEGKDQRWRTLSGLDPGPHTRSQDLWKAFPTSWHPSALILRLRLGLGIGITSDLLAFLISLKGNWASTMLIAKATNYSVYSIRRTAEKMAAALLIESTRQKPIQYRVEPKAWRELLEIEGEIPSWRFWHQLYSFASMLIEALEGSEWVKLSPYLLSTELRDLVESHNDTFNLNQIDYPEPWKYAGDEYLPAFRDFVIELTTWVRESV